jgi:sulfopyruvate decarboxylase subunit beta
MLLEHLGDRPVVANLGPSTDELWHSGDRDRNFYTYGSMGLCSSIALGMALSTDEQVISLDGDGSLLMNMGTIGTIGREVPPNLIVVVWDNEQWAQTGYQASHTAFGTDLEQVARYFIRLWMKRGRGSSWRRFRRRSIFLCHLWSLR